MTTVVIDGIEYVPKASVEPISDKALQECIRELVSIQYFNDQSHKHRAWAWDALNAIAPNIANLCSQNASAAFDLMNS